MSLAYRILSLPRTGGVLFLSALCFAAGVFAGATLGPAEAIREGLRETLPRVSPRDMIASAHEVQVLRVLDGDTFEARVRPWPEMDITTRVRLRRIDAPEMSARCESERVKALQARDALARLLAEGDVVVTRVGRDKYPGRVDADVATARTADVSAVLLSRGVVRAYDGGRRQSWCD